MSSPRCPKCGHANPAAAVICAGCDYILDTSFLGDDILDQPTGDDAPPPTSDADRFGGEAVIVGNLRKGDSDDANAWDSFVADRTGSFLTADTHDGTRVIEPAPVYVDRSTQQMLEPDAVLRLKANADLAHLQLSPFEEHVLGFVDGQRPVARLRKKSGLSQSDTKIALAMLIDRGLLELVGVVRASALDVDLEDESGTVMDEKTVEHVPDHAAADRKNRGTFRSTTPRRLREGPALAPCEDTGDEPPGWLRQGSARRMSQHRRARNVGPPGTLASGVFEHLHRRGRGLRVHSGERLGGQTEMREDGFDDGRLLEKRNDFRRAVAARADHDVDGEHPFQHGRPVEAVG
jgi:hypothetical protein